MRRAPIMSIAPRPLVAVALTLALAAAASGCGRAAPAAAVATPRSVDELRARVQAILDEAHLPGVGIGVVRDGAVVWVGGVGKADLARGTDVTADTRFRVGSITKSVVALAVLQLCEAGKLSLDARLADVAPELAIDNRWEATHPLRVAELLEHTAGFDDMHPSDSLDERPTDRPLRDVLAVQPASHTPRWPPGTRMAYSNPGYTVAGYLVEKASGRAFEDYIHDALLVPLGIGGAGLRLSADVERTLARGYDDAGRALPFVRALHRPAGNLIASPRELLRLVQLFIDRGRAGDRALVAAASIERAERGETLPYPGYAAMSTHYGLGNDWYRAAGFIARGHSGGIDGFASDFAYVARHKVGWVVLFNSRAAPDARRRIRELVAAFATDGLPRPTPPRAEVAPAALAPLAGYYRLASPRTAMFRFLGELFGGRTITLADGALWESGLTRPRGKLVPVAPLQLRREDDPAATVLFAHADDGTPIMIASDDYYERASRWPVLLDLLLLAAALAVALASCAAWLVRAARRLGGRRPSTPPPAVALAALATLCLGGLAACALGTTTMLQMSTRNAGSVGIFVFSTLYPLLALAAVVAAARRLGRRPRAEPLAVAVAHAALCAHLAAWGFVAFRVWGA